MKFEDVKEKMGIIHKLHTAKNKDTETVIYKKPYSAKVLTVITNDEYVFDLNKVTYMSLDELGLLVQYKAVDTNIMHPFPINSIEDIIIES